MRTQARVVIIGGGVAGCSIAYHLASLGWTDVLVLEQHGLTDGTTWHSAGFVGQLRSTISQTRMIMYSSELYPVLHEQTGLDPGWRGVGGLRLATTTERVEELRRQVSSAKTYGLAMELFTAAQARQMLPLLEVDDVRMAGWLPGDGYLEPASLAQALAAGARALGVEFATGSRVIGIETLGGRVARVLTEAGYIATEVLVNAAGAAAWHVGQMAGVALPVVPMKHQYAISSALAGAATGTATLALPTVRDPDHIVYFRGEPDGGLLVGGYSRTPTPCWPDGGAAPLRTARDLFEPDLVAFDEVWQAARRRVPALRGASIARVVHGPEAFTPDGEFLLGETSVGGFWVAAGFCVHGLAAAGGVGKVIAEWIVDGQPEFDVSHMDIRRFGGHAASRSWATTKALEAYSRYYDVVYPHQEWAAARPLRRSPVWPRLAELDASLGEKAGWERVNWFESNAPGDSGWRGADLAAYGGPAARSTASAVRPAGWAGQIWSAAIAAEVRATTEAAGLFDQSSFAKFDVVGAGAGAALNQICANDVDSPPGRVTYTQLLNGRGGIEADLTVTRLAGEHFRVVTSTASAVRDLAWLRRHLDPAIHVTDVTSAYGCLCLWGPASREILSPLTDGTIDTLRFMRAIQTTVGHVPALVQRVTFVGEYGYELYAPAEYTLTLWDTLRAAGRSRGLRPGGYRAIDSMRVEKGYRVWGSDITPETTPDEAGLSFAVRITKPFLGRDALIAARLAGLRRRLRCLVLDDPTLVCLGTEPIRVDGVPVGRVTSGNYGYRVGASIAFGYLPPTVAEDTRVEVGVFGTWVGATVRADPLFDPQNTRVRDQH